VNDFSGGAGEVASEILLNQEDILVVTPELVVELKRRALASPRRRARLCMHHSTGHLTQEMLIVFHRDSSMPPHRHPQGKSESYHLLEGCLRVFLFTDDGRVFRVLDLEAGKSFLYRLAAPHWHMPVPLSEWVVYHEVYTGPFVKTADVEFAPWAPPETSSAEAAEYLALLLAKHADSE